MLIQTVIDHIKEYHKGVFEGKQIDEQTTRDKVLYGNPHQECTGIITTCWASVDVIREAAKRGANLIIAHETGCRKRTTSPFSQRRSCSMRRESLSGEIMTIFIPAYRWKMAAILMVFFMVWRINWAGRNILQRIFIIHCISQYQKQQSKSLRIF